MLKKYSFKLLLFVQALLLTVMLAGVNPVSIAQAAAVKIMPVGNVISGSPALVATPTECLTVSGHIRVGSSTGPGLAGVSVVGIAPSGGRLTGTSDASGLYTLMGGCGSPGSLTVTPQLTGFSFAPASQNFAGVAVDFVATAVGPTATPTRTPPPTITPTRTMCTPPTAEALRVSPVTSPVSSTSEVVTVTLGNSTNVTITDEAGSFTSTTPVNRVFSITVGLVPNSTNHLQVLGSVTYAPGCPPYTLSTTMDTNGNPLTIVQSSGGVTNTPTPTPTPTPVITLTPTATTPCSPVTATIAAPFTKDGAGTFCWQTSSLGSYINSWNLAGLSINGVNIANMYIPSSAYPAKIGGFWYISYSGNFPWSHFETK